MSRPSEEDQNERLFREFMEQPGQEMVYEIHRSLGKHKELTFSAEGMEHLIKHLNVYIGTRLMRYWHATGKPAKAMRVRIRVALDEDPDAFADHTDLTTRTERIGTPPKENDDDQ